jgi:5-methylcytosine-specific restriction endonuclease McrA
MPLKAGGTNDILNIQLLCKPCNLSKGAKHPIDFMQQRGFLL